MKKKFLVMVLLLACLFMTACGSKDEDEKESKKDSSTKVLSCVMSEKEEDVEISMEFKFSHDGKKYTKGEMIAKYVIDDEEMMEFFKEMDICESFEDEEAESYYKACKSETTDNSLVATIDLDLDKMEEETEDDDELPFHKDGSIDELKEGLEDNGFKCTVK